MLTRILRGYRAVFVLPFVLALRYERRLFLVLIVGANVFWFTGYETAGIVLCFFAVLVSTLALGASLERLKHREAVKVICIGGGGGGGGPTRLDDQG